jgi:hypothetical protein
MMATFDDTTFEHERKHPDRIKLWVEHDSSLEVGQLSRVYPQENWCAFSSRSTTRSAKSSRQANPCRSA